MRPESLEVIPQGRVVGKLTGMFRRFATTESTSSVVLMACTAIALALANSPVSNTWERFWSGSHHVGPLHLTAEHFVNDGLMTLFFFLVGLEIKREFLQGELRTRRKAMLPIIGAIGGMIAPAVIYLAINRRGPATQGWAIPTATDIAFALGVLALLGSRVPSGIKVFLAALAIIDDMLAVTVIALFYTSAIHWGPLLGAVFALLVAQIMNARNVQSSWAFSTVGLAVWVLILFSGVHATIAGVLFAFTIPTEHTLMPRTWLRRTGPRDMLQRMEHRLQPWVIYLIVPAFALANAGVSLRGGFSLPHGVAAGVALGLLIGKPLGICTAVWVATTARVADMPHGIKWSQLHGASWLAGIGFTMALFVSVLAFGNSAEDSAAKLGILAGSILAGLIGTVLLRFTTTERVQERKATTAAD